MFLLAVLIVSVLTIFIETLYSYPKDYNTFKDFVENLRKRKIIKTIDCGK